MVGTAQALPSGVPMSLRKKKKAKERQGAGVSIALLKHQRKQGADLLFRQVALI